MMRAAGIKLCFRTSYNRPRSPIYPGESGVIDPDSCGGNQALFQYKLYPPLFSIYPGESGASPPIRAAEIKLCFSTS